MHSPRARKKDQEGEAVEEDGSSGAIEGLVGLRQASGAQGDAREGFSQLMEHCVEV